LPESVDPIIGVAADALVPLADGGIRTLASFEYASQSQSIGIGSTTDGFALQANDSP
jgi:hypothetical protein